MKRDMGVVGSRGREVASWKEREKMERRRRKERTNRQLKQYGTAIPLPRLGVSVKVSKVSWAVASKGMQSRTMRGF